MVRNRQKTIKELPTRAQPSTTDEKDVILAPYQKKNCLQPPPASRHRSVLKLDRVVPLFDMRSHTSKNIHDIIMSSRGALPIQKLTTISTDRLSEVEEDPRFVELLVSFYSPAPEGDFFKSEFQVVMPRSWTPKIYLGALHQSITTNSMLTLESISISGRNYTTMNELNWLFHLQKDIIHTRLVISGSYQSLKGGEFNKIESSSR
jgi:hypothetical protein